MKRDPDPPSPRGVRWQQIKSGHVKGDIAEQWDSGNVHRDSSSVRDYPALGRIGRVSWPEISYGPMILPDVTGV